MTLARARPAPHAPASDRLVTDRPPPHERILAVARDLFCRNGIHATGIDRILAEAGASKMTLYSRFGSKEALLREVLARQGVHQRTVIFACMDAAGPDPRAAIAGVIDGLRALCDGDEFLGCAFMNAAAEHTKGLGAEPWLRDAAQAHAGEIHARVATLAEAAGCPDPITTASQVLLTMDGAIAGLMVSGDLAVLDTARRTIRAILG